MAKEKKELDRFDEHAKRNVPIVVKLLAVIIAAAVTGVVGVAALELNIFAAGVNDSTNNDLQYFSDGIDMTLKDWRNTLESDAMMLSNRPDVSALTAEKDVLGLQTIAGWANGTLNVNVLAFTDKEGAVLAGEGVSSEEKLQYISSVQSALRGTAGYSYDEIGSSGYSMIASAPIRSSGKVVGSVVTAFSLEDGKIIQQATESYNAVCTIFNGTKRVASSLGEEYIGTQLDSKTISDEVLKNANEYHGYNTIDGKDYMSVYFPLESSNGIISGMVFIARSVEIVNAIQNPIR